MTEKNWLQARSVFDTLCQTLENHHWHYLKNSEQLYIACEAQGEDLPMKIRVYVDPERLLVTLVSYLPFRVPEALRDDFALLICQLNYRLLNGAFDFNYRTGKLGFRMTNSFQESFISQELFTYMLFISCRIIDQYNDSMLRITQGTLDVHSLLDSLMEGDE